MLIFCVFFVNYVYADKLSEIDEKSPQLLTLRAEFKTRQIRQDYKTTRQDRSESKTMV